MSKHKVFNSDSEESGIENEDKNESGEEDQSDDQVEAILADSDSDDAPEDVSFTVGRESALSRVRGAISQVTAERKKAKEKRRKHNEEYLLQKKRKLDTLAKSKLSDDILMGIASKHPVQQSIKKSNNAMPEVDHPNSEEEDEGDADDESQDFIPLEQQGFKVVSLKEDVKKVPTSFKQQMLFGDRVHRESVQSYSAKAVKRKARFK